MQKESGTATDVSIRTYSMYMNTFTYTYTHTCTYIHIHLHICMWMFKHAHWYEYTINTGRRHCKREQSQWWMTSLDECIFEYHSDVTSQWWVYIYISQWGMYIYTFLSRITWWMCIYISHKQHIYLKEHVSKNKNCWERQCERKQVQEWMCR